MDQNLIFYKDSIKKKPPALTSGVFLFEAPVVQRTVHFSLKD